jgi:F-type H+-transporting ATPase subunit delta
MSESKVAERYARAIFEIGEESGLLASMSEQLTRFAREFSGSRELREALTNPAFGETERAAIIQTLAARLQLSPVSTNTVRVLSARRRLSALPAIAVRLQSLTDERHGLLRVKVTSAKPLAESYFQRLASQVEAGTGRKVVLEKVIDSALIAGVITQIGGHTIDGTVRGRLAKYEQRLLAGH